MPKIASLEGRTPFELVRRVVLRFGAFCFQPSNQFCDRLGANVVETTVIFVPPRPHGGPWTVFEMLLDELIAKRVPG
jgi:hypothetical protein